MDKRNRSGSGAHKIRVRTEDDEDNTLAKLYSESEFTHDNAAPDDEKAAEVNADLSDFIDNAGKKLKDEDEVPAKAGRQKAKKPKAKHSSSTFKKILKVAIPLLIIVAAGTAITLAFFRPAITIGESDQGNATTTEADKIYYSPLTGNEVKDAATVTSAVTCVMIENSIDARPQSGLDQAGVVYEAIAEGGITRFMALFQEAKPQYIGPVRSVRLTYAELAKPYQCSIAHVGGSGNALNLIRNSSNGYRDIDQYFNGSFYWRISSRRAPHNVYTSFEKLDQLNFNKGYTTSNFKGFARVSPDEAPAASEQNATTINITMSSNSYNPVFNYDAVSNTYKRSHVSGGPHLVVDGSGAKVQLAPTVVIAMKVDPITRTSETRFSDYTTTGSGDAFVFQNGSVTVATWQRTDVNSELKFVDKTTGNEILLNRGQTWISLYPSRGGAVTWK